MILDQYGRERFQVNSGVRAIVNPNILMSLDDFGVFRAYDRHSGNNVGLISACGLEKQVDSMSDESMSESDIALSLFSENAFYNPILGYYRGIFAGYVAIEDYRSIGSSGGLATWLLVQLLQTGLVDGVIHFKQCSNSCGTLFRYGVSTTVEEIKNGAKSRYYPGELSGVLSEALLQGKRYAITGIPSFISEVRLLAVANPIIGERIKYYVGLICGHQKSTKYAEALAWQYGIKPGDLHSIDFRKKCNMGRASEYFTEMIGVRDGRIVTLVEPISGSFVANWGHGFFKSFFSDFTDDVFNETADVVLGDAWLPEYDHDGGGNNVVIVRNAVVEELLAEAQEAGHLKLDRLSEEAVIRSQGGLVRHGREELAYRLQKIDSRGEWRPRKRFAAINGVPFWRRRVQDVREKIAVDSHIVYREAVERDSWDYFESRMRKLTFQYALVYRLMLLSQLSPMCILLKLVRRLRRYVRYYFGS